MKKEENILIKLKITKFKLLNAKGIYGALLFAYA